MNQDKTVSQADIEKIAESGKDAPVARADLEPMSKDELIAFAGESLPDLKIDGRKGADSIRDAIWQALQDDGRAEPEKAATIKTTNGPDSGDDPGDGEDPDGDGDEDADAAAETPVEPETEPEPAEGPDAIRKVVGIGGGGILSLGGHKLQDVARHEMKVLTTVDLNT